MAHEITATDNVVLHKEKAWHGLGIVVENAPTPTEALAIAGLDWEVDSCPMYALGERDGQQVRIAAERHVANVRRDTQSILGVVGTNYQPVQNKALAEFSEQLAQQGDVVKVESAGSIRGGEKVWFLLKGESFSVRQDDEITPYICVSNGHDGATSVRCTPTTVRVVCSNTLHQVIPQDDKKATKLHAAGISFRHLGDVKENLEQARQALGLYQNSIVQTRQIIDALAAKDVSRELCQRFFLECYTRDHGAIPMEPKTESEVKAKEKAMDGFEQFAARFDKEQVVAGATAWNAFNAYTGWSQHDRRSRRTEGRAWNLLNGMESERSVSTLQTAMNLL